MNLWLVDNKIYVIADGIAGAIYLSGGENAVMLYENFVDKFKPRVISEDEMKIIMDKRLL